MNQFLKELRFNEKGLIPAIIQEAGTNEVLMLAYMNERAITETIVTGRTHFWSRSREKLWKKGETSGCEQIVQEILFDCDEDALLIRVHQRKFACHTGYKSCFYRKINGKKGEIVIVGRKFVEGRK
ncbi:phosphoribosyl-AMP cyclohydrolase [candidate division NPL-UPA2 bacterium Unc8]|uniref:Phosphoribosyl-AMP cyclohydrolase n=2 Tax=Bacteria TaxID=2 RepID=A0A9E2BGF7_PSYF1|nr:Phosphoribosyl-AMP cyclohydrolase [Bacillota bacterium]MBT9145052.1 Phosphoribosyl-AMP cyclohydrolase [Candidatus Psychracetigena formicireducens]MBT9147873.1 Phosphoribosyl-AMP cyclohydrolase [Bacillota bacterium]RII01106.1 MAG: phosphoribosyl-AMP cyclohydrolase [candidate division NPL-UPA2 bacterium Unc8]